MDADDLALVIAEAVADVNEGEPLTGNQWRYVAQQALAAINEARASGLRLEAVSESPTRRIMLGNECVGHLYAPVPNWSPDGDGWEVWPRAPHGSRLGIPKDASHRRFNTEAEALSALGITQQQEQEAA